MSNLNAENLVNFMELSIRRAGYNVPAPQPVLEKKLMRTNKAVQDAWADLMIATKDLSDEDCQTLAKIFLQKCFGIIFLLNLTKEFKDETTETMEFLHQHEEYLKPESMEELFGGLL